MRIEIDSVSYSVEVTGDGHPLLLLHGFTGAAASWSPHIPRLAGVRRVIAPDLLGHGATGAPGDPHRYRMERAVADLLALLDALDAPRADVLGYSMGGRVALSLAAAAPRRVTRLILESATPGLVDPEERAARVAADEALAATIEREGVAAFVARWESLPLFAGHAGLPAETRERLRAGRLANRPGGLAGSLRGMGTGRMPALWEQLGELGMPTLLVAGALDEKFSAIARRMAALVPRARLAIVPDAGHTVHLERPDAFTEAVLGFLGAAHGRQGGFSREGEALPQN